ncbi:MAG: phosphoribosylanthranilate isomerase [Syntrophobacterales bacterium]|jgi:phosphoribosylanthranilate isomerase|nr:phosphoribosylanthranilate isomerase [Syntrophobacterales bacterium]
MVRIKICGITNLDDALLAAELGADALGFIFYPQSPRHVPPEAARHIIAHLPPFVAAVGVFVDEDAAVVQDLAAKVGLDWVQLHGRESPDYCRRLNLKVIKGFRIQDETSLKELERFQGAAQALLLDTYKKGQVGGTGESFDWQLAREAKKYGRIILAGGLTPGNVARALEVARPDAVDAASGTEAAPGKKDPAKLRAFFQAIAQEPLAHP